MSRGAPIRLAYRAGLTLGLWAATAQAQKANLDAQLFQPPATSGGVLDVDSAFVAPHLSLAGALYLSYDHDPLVLRDTNNHPLGAVVGHQFTGAAALSLGLWRHLEVGVLLPVLLYQTVNDRLFPTAHGLSNSAVGDVRIEAKVYLGALRVGRGQLGFGVAASLGAPSGNDHAFFGEGGVTFRPRAMATLRSGPLDVTVQLGAVVRSDRVLADLHVGEQLSYAVGARVALFRGLQLSGALSGLVGLTGTGGVGNAPLELLLGPSYRFARLPIELEAAGGAGLTQGYSAPDGRVVVSLRFAPRDRDGDGLADNADACPDRPGPRHNRGCPVAEPERDEDGDGLVDRLDRCPHVAGPVKSGGCPAPTDDSDRDGDGIVDRLDSCPSLRGPVANRGCPILDRDGDGVLDPDDRCPTVAGSAANRGCPDVDTDGDGIVDRLDKCPTEKEVFNGIEDEDGCPDKGPTLAVLTERGIEIRQQIFFELNKAVIKPKSFALLATVARLLLLHPEILKLRIEGHTDGRGAATHNLKLSTERADAVRRHLISVDNIAAERLSSRGFGASHPIADNATDAGRTKNRRCEFVITERTP